MASFDSGCGIGSINDLLDFFRFADEIDIPVAVEEELFDAVLLFQAQRGQLVEGAVQRVPALQNNRRGSRQ